MASGVWHVMRGTQTYLPNRNRVSPRIGGRMMEPANEELTGRNGPSLMYGRALVLAQPLLVR
jgi:hypothetical protein